MVEVARSHTNRTDSRACHSCAGKAALTVPEQDGNHVGVATGHYQVSLLIAIHVSYRYSLRRACYRVRHRFLEGAVPVANEDGDRIRIGISGHQILLAVAVEIGGNQRRNKRSRLIAFGLLKGSITIAEKYRYQAPRMAAGYRQVQLSVVVEIRRNRLYWSIGCVVGNRRCEGSVAVAHQHGQSIQTISDSQV